MNASRQEVEVKLRVADLGALKRRLAKLRARPAPGSRVRELNWLFDTPQGGLAKHGQLLRLRVAESDGKSAERRVILTYKGPAIADAPGEAAKGKRYKVRKELEAGVSEAEPLRQILEALGLRGWFRYEKYRTTYRLPPSQRWAKDLKIELDETPIGVYLELEGAPGAIDQAAQLLGYTHSDYITKSYLALYLAECRKQGRSPADMVFPAKKK